MKRDKLAKFVDDIISIDEVKTLKIVSNDDKVVRQRCRHCTKIL